VPAEVEQLESRKLLTFTFHGGALLANVEAQAVYLGSDWKTSTALQSQAAATDQYLATLVQSPYMDMLTNAGYNVGRGTATAGAVDNIALNKTTGITDAQIQSEIQSMINSGQLNAPDANRLYVVNVEPGVVVHEGSGASNTTFLGYHSAFAGTTSAGAPVDVHYAVIPAPGTPNFTSASQGFSSDFNEVTSVTSHELAESVTDPNVNYKLLGWYDDQKNGEIADFTHVNTVMSGYVVQDVYDKNDQLISPVTVSVAPSDHFEFGTRTSPVATGYTAVNEGTTYSAARGYGWQSGTVYSRDDTTPGLTTIQRGYDYTKGATFVADRANGTYNVTVTMGDAGWMHDSQGVFLQGAQVDSVTTSVRQFYTRTYTVTVTNGQLTLKLQDLGGVDPNVVINALDIVQSAAPPPASNGQLHLEFGTRTSPVATGYTAVNEGTTYSVARGYGWQSGTVYSRDDTTPGLTTIQRGYNYTKGATFVVDRANGTYDVTVTMGDAGWSHDSQGVFLQGAQVDSVTTNVRQFYTHTYTVTVTNGQLTLKLQDLGGSDPNVVINALDIVQSPAAPPVSSGQFHFEFGTPTSPVATGYTAVNEGTAYSAAQGYGWQSGTVYSRDDTTPGLTTIQRGYDYTKGATFAVDLANGTYNVTVTMGDAAWMHDSQGLFLQGVQVDSVTTNVKQFYTHTYSVTVTNGQLTLKLQDLGGVDPNVVINALDIVQST